MARDFDSVTSQWLSSAAPPFTGFPGSCSVWFQNDSTAAGVDSLVSISRAASPTQHHIELRTDAATVSFHKQAGGGSTIDTAATVNTFVANTWAHGAFRFDTSNFFVYLDGDIANRGTGTYGADPNSIDQTFLGQRNAGSQELNGRLAEVACWNVMLTEAEIITLSLGVSPLQVRPDKLLSYWPLYGVSSPEIDRFGTAPLTLNGAPPAFQHVPMIMPTVPHIITPGVAAGGGQDIDVGIAIETDTVPGVLTWTKAVDVGLAAEADTALAIRPNRDVPVGLASEIDTVPGVLTHTKAVTLGIPVEVDTAFTVTWTKAVNVGIAVETDTAFAITTGLSVELGIAIETDSAFVVTWSKAVNVGIASEADSGLAVTAQRAIAVGQASEVDTAFAVGHTKAVNVGIATEIDTAFAMSITGGGEAPASTYRPIIRPRRRH